jgi:colicin import membrane protein
MTTAAPRARRHRWHAPERGTGPAFMISLAAHTALFLAIAFVVRWKTEPAGPVSAELWGGLPPIVEPAPPPPPIRIERAPEPEFVKPDIVIEEQKPKPRPEPRPEKKVEPVKKVDPPRKAEPDLKAVQRQRDEEARAQKAAEAAAEKQHQAALARMTAAATGAPGSAASGSPGFSDSYKGQIAGCIKPHIAFNVPSGIRPGQHTATFEVNLLPTGEQVGPPRMIKSSGLPAYDQAVERAIRRCDPFPRPREGSVPRLVPLDFDPVDTQRN